MKLVYLILFFLVTIVAIASAGHALISKRDPKGALGWIAVCLMFPFVGPFLYFLFGINRVQTRAKKLHRSLSSQTYFDYERQRDEEGFAVPSLEVTPEFIELSRVSDIITKRPLVGGNRVELLHNGEQAYPAMLETIEGAQHTLFLTTYIFRTDNTGRQFIEALARAAERGVDVRVMIDGIGEMYSIPRAGKLLKKRGVRVARFLPPRLLPPILHVNLRNHRKIMVADRRIAFTGGMNISAHHLAEKKENSFRVIDTHFRLTGPIVTQIEEVFIEDWGFITGEYMETQPCPPVDTGTAICRTIVEGPNEDLDKLSMILLGAISSARRSISIMTPYFIPTRGLLAALQAAALRGIHVTVILPSRNNLPLIHWATRNLLWELLQWGVYIYYQPPPFVHTKLVLIDNHYLQIGSANIDPRSLRLNFELAVEVYDRAFAKILAEHFENIRVQSRPVSLQEMDSRSLPARVRDSLAWLFSPYL